MDLLIRNINEDNSEFLKLILNKKVNPNFNAFPNKDTLLMYCIRQNSTRCINVLLDHNADIYLRNSKEETAMGIASILGHFSILSLFSQQLNGNNNIVNTSNDDCYGSDSDSDESESNPTLKSSKNKVLSQKDKLNTIIQRKEVSDQKNSWYGILSLLNSIVNYDHPSVKLHIHRIDKDILRLNSRLIYENVREGQKYTDIIGYLVKVIPLDDVTLTLAEVDTYEKLQKRLQTPTLSSELPSLMNQFRNLNLNSIKNDPLLNENPSKLPVQVQVPEKKPIITKTPTTTNTSTNINTTRRTLFNADNIKKLSDINQWVKSNDLKSLTRDIILLNSDEKKYFGPILYRSVIPSKKNYINMVSLLVENKIFITPNCIPSLEKISTYEKLQNLIKELDHVGTVGTSSTQVKIPVKVPVQQPKPQLTRISWDEIENQLGLVEIDYSRVFYVSQHDLSELPTCISDLVTAISSQKNIDTISKYINLVSKRLLNMYSHLIYSTLLKHPDFYKVVHVVKKKIPIMGVIMTEEIDRSRLKELLSEYPNISHNSKKCRKRIIEAIADCDVNKFLLYLVNLKFRSRCDGTTFYHEVVEMSSKKYNSFSITFLKLLVEYRVHLHGVVPDLHQMRSLKQLKQLL